MNNRTNTSRSIMVMMFTLAFVLTTIVSSSNNVQALTQGERFESGYNQGILDCGHPDIIDTYKHSDVYWGHSQSYHDGYFSGSNSCGGDPNYYPTHYPQLFNTNIEQQHSNNNNGNTFANSQHTIQTQANLPHITCIGTCFIPNTQNAESSNTH